MNEGTPTPENEDPRAAIWQDDVLDRRGFADFLTNALTEQTRVVSERQQRGLTVALDAGWGTGKTFFVERWAADLKKRGHPVVFFDAWENDLGEEAAVALMATIKQALDDLIVGLPATQEIKTRGKDMVQKSVKQLRKAVLPVSKVIVKGLLKKSLGFATEEVTDAFNSQETEAPESSFSVNKEEIEAGLDKLFETALADQRSRSEAIQNFKETISSTLTLIKENSEASLPMFVFVDELDRCRPSYAIRMLEEIKHLFGIADVCFIISTNLEQLACSIQAVYGHGFDAGGYLKRFFQQIFSLPPPDNRRYAQLLWKDATAFSDRQLALGLPDASQSAKRYDAPEDAISLVFEVFDLDLRSQRQVFAIAGLAAASIDKNKKIFLMWLFFLSALIHKKLEHYASLMKKPKDAQFFNSILNDDSFRYIQTPNIWN
jgi:hypothetical protein